MSVKKSILSSSTPLISVAPMIDWTDRHCRFFLRLMSSQALLYTEMITTNAILHGNSQHLLAFDLAEKPVVLQLGGNDPQDLATCAKIGANFGYDAINLNVGCPSNRVQQGQFGACLMAKPELVADCIAAMRCAVTIPITIKTRLGIDHHDDAAFIDRFITLTAAQGCQTFIIHARKAWLTGLSPQQNRTIPPLRYDEAQRLVDHFPHLTFILNGGIKTITDCQQHLQQFNGVMLGRAIMQNPYLLQHLAQALDQEAIALSPQQILQQYYDYLAQHFALGVPLSILCRPIINLFHGLSGARYYRQTITAAIAARSLEPLAAMINEQ